jgi:hypothetical protein
MIVDISTLLKTDGMERTKQARAIEGELLPLALYTHNSLCYFPCHWAFVDNTFCDSARF